MENIRIPRRISTAIINSLTAGVVPRIGLEYITVGRKREIDTLLADLENIGEGGSSFRFICGRYGSGKSFLLQLIRNYAMDRDFVTADADLTPERRLVGTKGQGRATYRELMQNLAIKARPDGGALESILLKWIQGLQISSMRELDMDISDPAINDEVNKKIYEIIGNIDGMSHGFDFSSVVSAYWNAYRTGNEDNKQSALRWLRGEYATKTEAKKDLNVGEIITDENWYDYMKLFSSFLGQIGYKGLLLFIDEGVNLYKISNKTSRDNNYEKLLSMFNDTMQGKASNLGILFGATPQLIEDNRRGLYSYEALRSRLVSNSIVSEGFVDLNAPVMKLQVLTNEEMIALLRRIINIHGQHYKYEVDLSIQELTKFLTHMVNRVGADKLLTPREVTREFIGLLNMLQQDSSLTVDKLITDDSYIEESLISKEGEDESDDLFAGFTL